MGGMDRSGFYRGTVVSNADPDGLYRVRADVPQILGVSTMGWCRPMMGRVNGVPEVDEQIWVAFEAGDVNYPLYIRGNTLTTDSLTDGALVNGTGLDARTPSAPQNLTIDSTAYLDSLGNPLGRVSASWDTVVVATDGTAISIGGYELWGRPVLVAPLVGTWAQITTSTGATAAWAPFDVGSSWEFEVRARATASPTLGEFSAPEAHVVSSALAAPNDPSTPTVTSFLGQVFVVWDGNNSSGQPMPGGFSYVQVAIDSTSVLPTLPALPPLYGQLRGAGTTSGAFTAGVVRYVRIRSVDVLGTASAWTSPIPITVVSVYGDSSFDPVRASLSTITGAVQIVQGSLPGVLPVVTPSVTVTDSQASPTMVQITPGVLAFYSTGTQVASIDGTVAGGLMTINASHIARHIIQPYLTDPNITIVKWVG